MKNGLEVFDFKEGNEIAELAAGKVLGKFKNPSLDNPFISKYRFLECCACSHFLFPFMENYSKNHVIEEEIRSTNILNWEFELF